MTVFYDPSKSTKVIKNEKIEMKDTFVAIYAIFARVNEASDGDNISFFKLGDFRSYFSDSSKKFMASDKWKSTRAPIVFPSVNIRMANSAIEHFEFDTEIIDFGP